MQAPAERKRATNKGKQPMNNEQFKYEEDEIDLKELWQIIVKNKRFILIFTSIVTILAIVWSFTRTPIYEVKSNLQIGFIGKELIENPNTLVKITRIVFNVNDKPELQKEFISKVTDIALDKKIKKFIEIKTQAISNDEALKLNKKVVTYIQDKYKNKIEHYINDNNNNIKNIKDKIKNLENLETKNLQRQIYILKNQKIINIDKKIKFYKTKISTLTKEIKFYTQKLQEYTTIIKKIYKNQNNLDSASTIIVSLQTANYQNLILDSQNKIEDLKLEIQSIKTDKIPNLQKEKENIQNDTIRKLEYKLKVELPHKKQKLLEQIAQYEYQNSKQNVQNSKVVGDYIIKKYPVKPKKKLIVIVAFVTGLILSIFLVFFLEFIRGYKENS